MAKTPIKSTFKQIISNKIKEFLHNKLEQFRDLEETQQETHI